MHTHNKKNSAFYSVLEIPDKLRHFLMAGGSDHIFLLPSFQIPGGRIQQWHVSVVLLYEGSE